MNSSIVFHALYAHAVEAGSAQAAACADLYQKMILAGDSEESKELALVNHLHEGLTTGTWPWSDVTDSDERLTVDEFLDRADDVLDMLDEPEV